MKRKKKQGGHGFFCSEAAKTRRPEIAETLLSHLERGGTIDTLDCNLTERVRWLFLKKKGKKRVVDLSDMTIRYLPPGGTA